MIVALGQSEDFDSADAIAEVLQQCAKTLGGRTPQAGLLYAGIDHDFQTLLDAVTARYPGIQLIGCTTHGELSSTGFSEDSVVLMLFHSDRVMFRAGVGEGVRADPEGAAQQAVAMARDGMKAPVRLGVTLPEGLGIDLRTLLDGLSAELGRDVPICGGLAGDQVRFEHTYQFCNGTLYSDAAPVLLFGGPLHVATGVASGWEPIGAYHRVTSASGPVVSKIDGEAPRNLWIRYFGVSELTGIRNTIVVYPDESADFYLSAPLHFQEDGSVVVLNPIPSGARIRFADATRDQVLSGAGASTARAQAAYPGTMPDAALIFSCAGRHAQLGTLVSLEIGQFQERMGVNLPTIGFYTYSEICPLPASPTPRPHSATFVTVLIGEHA